MGKIRENFKFKLIKNFLSQEEIELLKHYTIIFHRNNNKYFDPMTNLGETNEYGSSIMESLMISKQKKIEKETQLKILPTYSYWRMYVNGSDLKKHKDREACEISCTINIASDGTPWPIYMDETKINMEAGDAIIYLGCEVEHYRESFEGDWYSAVFIHYVDLNGPNKDFVFDKRSYLGRYKNV